MPNTSDTGKSQHIDYDFIPVGKVGDSFGVKPPAGLSIDLQSDRTDLPAGVHPVIGITCTLMRSGLIQWSYLLANKKREAVAVTPSADDPLTPNHGFPLVDDGLVYGVEWMETSTSYKDIEKTPALVEVVMPGSKTAAPAVKATAVNKSSPSAKAAAKKAAAAPPTTPGPGKRMSPSARAASMKAKKAAATTQVEPKVQEVVADHPAKSMPAKKAAPRKAPTPKAAEVTAPAKAAAKRPGRKPVAK